MLDGINDCVCIAGMKTQLLLLFVLAGFAGVFAGCVETVDGRNETAVPFVKDKLESRYEHSVSAAGVEPAATYVLNPEWQTRRQQYGQ